MNTFSIIFVVCGNCSYPLSLTVRRHHPNYEDSLKGTHGNLADWKCQKCGWEISNTTLLPDCRIVEIEHDTFERSIIETYPKIYKKGNDV
ncbi:hypothetical protein [Flavobacterium sp.]|uniref:hypothetical protein n=1 Tax=Flavobacterium sp. TaxID=239 RepID=UPI002B4B1F11|nr:hypothetical protein [Flavobacterium sp.]HLF51519.1 hypothetical protein [Flavobacterium sp.]